MAEFRSRFEAIYAQADEPKTLWRLGGALNDFLRSHPGAIDVPEELVPALLASPIVDGRIIGLKLLNRCCNDPAKIAASICDALSSNHGSVVYGGLFELDNLLRRLTPPFELAHTQLLPRLENLRRPATPMSEKLLSAWHFGFERRMPGNELALTNDSRHFYFLSVGFVVLGVRCR